jgi:tetratricopeptide (TPR) repeat protein
MARKALKLSSDCADAYVLLAQEAATTVEQAIDYYTRGVAAGERALGPEAFESDVGHFWGILETRPYMRARLGLAHALWSIGRGDEAVAHGEEVLRLNPTDNQGARYLVLLWLQELGRDEDAGRLIRRYKYDGGTEWTWCEALAAFRKGGDRATARKALTQAVETNPHVAAYLTGRKKSPKSLPDFVSVGSQEEAAAFAQEAAVAWRMTPGALDWLSTALPARARIRSGP